MPPTKTSLKKTLLLVTASLGIHFVIAALLFEKHPFRPKEIVSFSVLPKEAATAPKPTSEKPRLQKSETGAQKVESENSNGAGESKINSAENEGPSLKLAIQYPNLSLKAREEGQAQYQLGFSKNNELVAYKLIQSTGYQRLDEAVRKVLQTQIKAATDQATREQVLIIDFRLKDRAIRSKLTPRVLL